MTDVTLVSCTNAKRDHEAPARILYDESAYFRKMRAWAESRGDPWYILSSRYGLVEPNTPIAPYDERGLSDDQGDHIAETLRDRGVDRVYVSAGRDYLDALTPALESEGIDVVDPFAGLRIGERMTELQARTHD